MKFKSILFGLIILLAAAASARQLPIGMNIGSNNYYSPHIVFSDVMKTASKWITFNAEGSSPWDTHYFDQIPLDSLGYPTEIPFTPEGGQPQKVRFLINNWYSGTYYLKFDGRGDMTVHSVAWEKIDSATVKLELTGQGGHVWIDIDRSVAGDYVRNMRIIPQAYLENEADMPLFLPKFIEGLQPFTSIRFMDWIHTNGSRQDSWDTRSRTDYYSQGLSQGIAIEYAVELANQLNVDPWFCMPHMADDDYHHQMARMVLERLDPDLDVYIEYSNEVWNWGFEQSHYVGENAPEHNNSYVSDDLHSINPTEYQHPEKDAYMMQRTFRLWREIFTGADAERLIRVGTGQHAWTGNSGRILRYLFKKDANGNPLNGDRFETSTGAGCDAFAVAGYFGFKQEEHDAWMAMPPEEVTADMVIDSVFASFDETSGLWTDETAEHVNDYGIDYLVYEGGQHMQPWQQGEWDYNHAVWDAQIHPRMYDLYMHNFGRHTTEHVNCQLFMAFSYISERESRWGSWGHLESLEQIGAENYMDIAPKYQALLDAMAGEIPTRLESRAIRPEIFQLSAYPNPFNPSVTIEIDLPAAGDVKIDIFNMLGRHIVTLAERSMPAGVHTVQWHSRDQIGNPVGSGLYLCRVHANQLSKISRLLLLK